MDNEGAGNCEPGRSRHERRARELFRTNLKIPQSLLAKQIQRIAAAQGIYLAGGEIGTAALGIAVAVASRGQNGLIRGDRKQARELAGGNTSPGRDFDSEIGIEKGLNGNGRLVVEQDDQLVAYMDERDLFVGDRGEIELGFLVVAEIDDDGLIADWLREPEDPDGYAVAGRD